MRRLWRYLTLASILMFAVFAGTMAQERIIGGLGARPPKHVYSVTVQNNDKWNILVKVTFSGLREHKMEVSEVINAGQFFLFSIKSIPHGTWMSTMHVKQVKVTSNGPSNSFVVHNEDDFYVKGPTTNVFLAVDAQPLGQLSITQLENENENDFVYFRNPLQL